MLEPRIVADELRSRPPKPLRVFWVRVSGDRDDFKRELIRRRGQSPVVPWVLRKATLQNPNSVMSDIVEILNDAREEIEAVRDAAVKTGGADLVLLGRTDLKLADTSSPILLPDWFPVAPGQTPAVLVKDLTWSARVPLSDPTLALDDLRRILHDVDHALTDRLQRSLETDYGCTNPLWNRIRRNDEKIGDELQRMKTRLREVSNPAACRPSTAHGKPTLVGLLWAHANGKAPDAVQETAMALADGLRIEDGGVDRDDASLAAVLNRPSSRMSNRMDVRVRWAFCLIVTVRGACQLVTAAAHADEYPRFGAQLLQATSHDLRSFLDDAAAKLRIPEVAR